MNPAANVFPCREGLRQMAQDPHQYHPGKGKEGDIALLEELAETAKECLPVCAGQERPQPGSEHDTLLQR